MPYKSEKILIKNTEHDRRIKLSDDDKKIIIEKYSTSLYSQRQLAKEFNVDRKSIYNVLNPKKYEQQLENNKKNKQWNKYYNKEASRKYKKEYRRYKQNLFLSGEIEHEKKSTK